MLLYITNPMSSCNFDTTSLTNAHVNIFQLKLYVI